MKTRPKEARCRDCRWIQEADSVAKTSFQGVGLCPVHGTMTEGRKEEALNLSRQIAAFDRRCSREEYTDTGEAWELLAAARKLLKRIGG